MGQIWDFLRSVSVHFGSANKHVLENGLIKSQNCPILVTSVIDIGVKLRLPEQWNSCERQLTRRLAYSVAHLSGEM